MIDYRAGEWGLHVAFGWRGSLAPRSLVVATPCAVITYIVATYFLDFQDFTEDTTHAAQLGVAAGTAVMTFILNNRSRTSYSRWWEGGTLLQKARGEWFNAYSSIMAFTSTKSELQEQVDAYTHFTARLFSLLMCCALQQVSPNRDRPFEILDLDGIDPVFMEFLNNAPDKVEIILQWIQRSMVLHMQTGVLPVAPPVLSRAFQEVSRGIVNLQNARKIADFPYPYPLAQVSMILQLLHWTILPFTSALALPREWAVLFVFVSTFALWCIHFNALDLEFPFGTRVNDLPMHEFQCDWNKSLSSLLQKPAQRPPHFTYDPVVHDHLAVAMSDASALYVPSMSPASNRNTLSRITVKQGDDKAVRNSAARSSATPRGKPIRTNHGLPDELPNHRNSLEHDEEQKLSSRHTPSELPVIDEAIHEEDERQNPRNQKAAANAVHSDKPVKDGIVDIIWTSQGSAASLESSSKGNSGGLLPQPKGLEPLILDASAKHACESDPTFTSI